MQKTLKIVLISVGVLAVAGTAGYFLLIKKKPGRMSAGGGSLDQGVPSKADVLALLGTGSDKDLIGNAYDKMTNQERIDMYAILSVEKSGIPPTEQSKADLKLKMDALSVKYGIFT